MRIEFAQHNKAKTAALRRQKKTRFFSEHTARTSAQLHTNQKKKKKNRRKRDVDKPPPETIAGTCGGRQNDHHAPRAFTAREKAPGHAATRYMGKAIHKGFPKLSLNAFPPRRKRQLARPTPSMAKRQKEKKLKRAKL